MTRPAVPAKVHLKMRFLKADGTPLASTLYRVRWGSAKAKPTPVAQTSSDGWVDEILNGGFSRGVVEFGDCDPKDAANTFVPRLLVDVVLVKPPGPPPKHKRPDKKDPAPDAPPGNPPSKGGSAPGQSPPGDPEGSPAGPAQPAAPPPGSAQPAAPPPGLISMPPEKSSTPDFKPEGRGQPKKLEPAGDPPVVTERQLDRLDRFAASYHQKRARVFHLAWRLSNLGYLGLWSGHLTFPIDGGKYADILDAINRYAYKHGLALVGEADMTSPGDELKEIWDHVEQTHDGF